MENLQCFENTVNALNVIFPRDQKWWNRLMGILEMSILMTVCVCVRAWGSFIKLDWSNNNVKEREAWHIIIDIGAPHVSF